MSAVFKSIPIHSAKSVSTDGGEKLIGAFNKRRSQELVVAFAGPIGCDVGAIVKQTEELLKDMQYTDIVHIKLSKFIQDAIDEKSISVDIDNECDGSERLQRYRSLQDGGKAIRAKTKNKAILAEYVAQEISLHRAKKNKPVDGSEAPIATGKVAYLIDQVKRPEEVSLLRAIYRNLFYLVGVTRVEEKRKRKLTVDEKIPLDKAARLMQIDRREGDADGQRLEKTLELADYFIRNDGDSGEASSNKIRRLLNLIHGDTTQSPTTHEQGMYAAYAAGLRSACLSRQVGAALANAQGEIISTGCNDVPRFGGGLYSFPNLIPDDRCVHKGGGKCFNDEYKHALHGEIASEIDRSIKAWPEDIKTKIEPKDLEKLIEGIYENTRLKSLIEFSRSVHAEMEAIISVARGGNTGVIGGTLYTTTFPCHSCARHIVAAGIHSVYFIEPYEKSLAKELHDDSIAFEVEEQKGATTLKVAFLHYEGVAPRKFQTFFSAGKRKDDQTGKAIPFAKREADKALPEYLDNYQDFELKAVEHLQKEIQVLKGK